MAIDIKSKEEFVKLRAQGFSYDKIVKILEVSKPTLIKWGKELQKEISEKTKEEMSEVQAHFNANKSARITVLSKVLDRITTEMSSRNFNDLSDDKLLRLYFETSDQLKKETPSEDEVFDEAANTFTLKYSLD